jgi:hypothetical protein
MNLEFGTPYHHKTIDQCRVIGRIGGLRAAHNRRVRRLAHPPAPAAIPEPERESAHQSSLLLDAKFPWLKNAWGRPVRRPTA